MPHSCFFKWHYRCKTALSTTKKQDYLFHFKNNSCNEDIDSQAGHIARACAEEAEGEVSTYWTHSIEWPGTTRAKTKQPLGREINTDITEEWSRQLLLPAVWVCGNLLPSSEADLALERYEGNDNSCLWNNSNLTPAHDEHISKTFNSLNRRSSHTMETVYVENSTGGALYGTLE